MTKERCCPDSFHLVNIEKIVDRLNFWEDCLPSVKPFYAIKTNNDPVIVAVLAKLGTGFDCASIGEIDQVMNLNVDPSRVIFAHPRKPNSAIEHAVNMKVKTMVFDSIEELDKMLVLSPTGKFVLRITTDDQFSSTPLSRKFGANLDEAHQILDYAFKNNADVIGIAFHVGSNCRHIPSYKKGIEDASLLFAYAKEKWDTDLSLLDIGGGWPGNDDNAFAEISKVVEQTLKEKIDPTVLVIAEPGRYFATQTTTAVIRILGKSVNFKGGEKQINYYLSNGVFGMFIGSLYYGYDSKRLAKEGWEFQPLKEQLGKTNYYTSVLWGPTCDSGDRILDGVPFPELATGDFIYSKNVGAYTYSVQTNFNQIPLSKPYYVWELSHNQLD